MATGQIYSFTNTVIKDRGIGQSIWNMDWQEAPLLRLLDIGGNNQKKLRLRGWPSTKVEWFEDTNNPVSGTLNEALDNSEDGVDVQTGEGAYLRQGDVILVESEKMLVKAVSANTLTVERGYGSTTAAAHDDDTPWLRITRAMPEGSDPVTGYTGTPSVPYNYVQIISAAAEITKTAMAVKNIPLEDEFDYQVAKLFDNGGSAGELPRMLANTFYYGERVQRDANNYGSMGGFKTYVTTNVRNAEGKTLQKKWIHDIIRNVRDYNGKITHLVMGSYLYEVITDMYSATITTTREERVGGSEIDTIKTPHGQVKLVYDWMCPAGEMYFVNVDKCGWLPLRPWERNVIKDLGDRYCEDIVGEYTFFLVNEKSHGYIHNIATS